MRKAHTAALVAALGMDHPVDADGAGTVACRGALQATMRRSPRIACAVLCCALAGCVYFSKHTAQGACADSLDAPIRNFCVVKSGALWRGERPTRADAAWLLAHGVGSVVNLEVVLNDRRAFVGAAAGAHATATVDYYHVPDFEPLHAVNTSLLDEHTAHFLAIMQTARKPVYVHCLDGIDRTGVVIAAYRVLTEGSSEAEAMAEMGRFGSPWVRVDARYLHGLLRERRDGLLRRVAELRSKVRPGMRIICHSGNCVTEQHLPPGD